MKRWIQFSQLILFLGLLTFSTMAQRPDQPEYGQLGPYAVGVQNIVVADENRPLGVSIWYPAEVAEDAEPITYRIGLFEWGEGRAVLDATPIVPSGEAYPLVVFSHGSGASRFVYAYLTEHLASHGFVVIAADHPTNGILDMVAIGSYLDDLTGNYVYRPQDILRLMDTAETLSQEGDLAGMIDMERVGIVGHSFGGYTALAAAGARLNFDQMAQYCASDSEAANTPYGICPLLQNRDDAVMALGQGTDPVGAWPALADPRIDVVVALAPWNGPVLDIATLGEMQLPTLFMVGSADVVTPADRDANFIFTAMEQAPRRLVTFENAGHYIFVDECGTATLQAGYADFCSDPVWDMERAHDLVNHFATAFLKSELLADGAATNALQATEFTGVGYEAANIGPRAEILIPQVMGAYPHDSDAFTQGLLLYEGTFYESTGRRGESTLRQVEPQTGDVLRSVDVDATYFAEGLARVDDRLIQLTWTAETAFVYDVETFELLDTFSYTGEGWGLCYDGETLYRSDGSDTIFLHDPETFEEIGKIFVNVQGEPVQNLNELECVDEVIYANMWQTDYILRIDKVSGYVTGVVIASDLLSQQETASLGSGGVLNGIAHDAENDLFYITGKLWPKVFAVEFVVP
jgi:glutaminyl-peptide cyclotransferase